MSRVLIRTGGVAAVIAAALIVVQQIWELLPGPKENIPDSAMYTTQLLLMVFGVIGIAIAQQYRAGRFAQISALIAVLGCVLCFAASETEVTYLPSLTAAHSPLVDKEPTALVIIFIVSFLTFLLGLLLLSAAIIVTRVLPWRAAVVLGGGLVMGLALGSVVPGILAVYAVGLGWLGVACIKVAGELAAGDGRKADVPVSQSAPAH